MKKMNQDSGIIQDVRILGLYTVKEII